MAEAFFVCRFQQAGPQLPMNLNSSADDCIGEFFMNKLASCLCGSVVKTHVCNTPTLNSGTSGFRAAASRACMTASRVSMGSMILSIQSRAAP